MPGFCLGPVGATALAHFVQVLPESLSAKTRMQLASAPGALLAVEQLARVLTQAQPIRAMVRTAGSGTERLPGGFGDIEGTVNPGL